MRRSRLSSDCSVFILLAAIYRGSLVVSGLGVEHVVVVRYAPVGA